VDAERARSIIQSRLQPGEQLVWYDSPGPWRAAARHLTSFAFITAWLGFVAALFAAKRSWQPDWWHGWMDMAVLIPALLILIGLFFWLVSLRDIFRCWHTAYGLTDRRVIIAVGQKGPTQSFGPDAFTKTAHKGDDRGHVLFDYGRRGRSMGFRHGLFGIAEPRRVEAAIKRHLIGEAATCH
jgi:hypothetical protein